MADQTSSNDMTNYIPYLRALKQLSDRLGATPEQMAAWVWAGPDQGGLAAYLDTSELEPPLRFYFDCSMGEDYVAAFVACSFLEDDIASFQATDRYITSDELR
ncbi:MAG: hypothetical protein P8173_05700, partial [Gammaproteobacteria bacterium]